MEYALVEMTRVSDDDESEIEAEIRRELDALGDDSLELLDLEEDEFPSIADKNDEDFMPDSLKEYLRFIQSRTEGAEEEVKECDSILGTLPQVVVNDDEQLAKRIKENLQEECEDPLALRNKVLIEIEEAELNERKQRSEKETGTEEMAIDIIREGFTGEIKALEKQALEKLRELEEKQDLKTQQRTSLYEEIKREEDDRKRNVEETRRQRQVELESAQQTLVEEMQVKQAMLENEVRQKEKMMHKMEQEFQFELKLLEEEQNKQNEIFLDMQTKEADYQRQRQQEAAVKLQKHYKGYRARVQFKPILEVKKIERQKKRKQELDRIERVEQKIREEQEKKKREKEELKEKKKQELEEKRREEERQRKEEDERLKREQEEQKRREEQERRKQEEEKKKRKEEERRLEEKRRQEEEKKKVEPEERKKREEKEEKERRRKEEEERQKKENVRKRKEEENRKREQEEQKKREEDESRRKEEQERKRKEEKRREQEDNRRKDEEENKRRDEKQEEEGRQQQEDNRRKEGEEENNQRGDERREQEQEEKQRQEKKRKGEKQREEEKKQQQEDNRRKEEEWRRRKEEFDKRLEDEDERKAEADRTNRDEDKKAETKNQNRGGEQNSKEMIKMNSSRDEKWRRHRETEIQKEERRRNDEVDRTTSGLTRDIEGMRKIWIKEHTPWRTITLDERTQPVAKSKPRRAFSASKHLPVLTEEQILQASPPWTPLHKVTAAHVENIPSCTMQGLHRCSSVKSLTLQNCGLLAVEGLEQCKQLQELRVQDNKIEAVNCRDLCELQELIAYNNSMTSIQGLDGCTELRSLDLHKNKITRIGDLSSCHKLQSLLLDHNQLIMTKGLSNIPHLQHLSCSHNHLPHVKEIDQCALLHSLNLQANNLQEPPLLLNHVLLRELRLDDNSISSLAPLSKAWLPLLQFLSISQNSISRVDSLAGLVMLHTLDISHNLISDTESLFSGVTDCKILHTLKIEGNPVHEDPNCREHIVKGLLSLKELDSVCVRNEAPIQEAGSFVALCNQQLRRQNEMKSKHEKEMKNGGFDSQNSGVLKRLKTKSRHYEEWFQLAVDQLREQENFSPGGYPQANHLQTDVRPAQERREETGGPSDSRKHAAATRIQALWRGWYIRHCIDDQTRRWMAAVTIQATWRGHWDRSLLKERGVTWQGRHHTAATCIQACYRGYRIRRRLSEALKSAQYYDSDEPDEFDYDEEVDLCAFEFDVSELDKGWTPSDTPQLPSSGPVLTSSHIQKPKNTEVSHEVPWPTRRAWRSIDSPVTNIRSAIKPASWGADVSMATVEQDQMSVTSGSHSHLSRRAEELSSEWGFKNADTAERMMQRARKMKYNPARKKKLLDPSKRLALFKKLDEANKLRDVKPPPRRLPNRVEYFSAREAMSLPSGAPTPTCEREAKAEMTYSWVYKQAVVHQDEQENIMSDRKEYAAEDRPRRNSPPKSINKSPVNLPQMSAIALSGRNVPLVSSPLFHGVAEETMSSVDQTRRRSLSSENVRFPPLKTYSVPNLTVRSSESGNTLPEKSNSAGARMSKEKKGKRR